MRPTKEVGEPHVLQTFIRLWGWHFGKPIVDLGALWLRPVQRHTGVDALDLIGKPSLTNVTRRRFVE